ncbi:MAG TPA: DUF5683 domain-containing protein, partial [Ferruginibacter sp.]|nr:DUF5683 domain-containing protein [Ferruginibacter sp.]
AQKKDSTVKKKVTKEKFSAFKRIDTSAKYNPRIAIVRSAIIPGWGQFTNKKYWKIPIVYGALGITAGVFLHNVKQFREARDAYTNAIDGDTSNDYLIPQPYYTVKDQPDRIRNFRNQVRQNVDYSALFFVIFWGLNVADAAVDAHLKTFDVSDNLSVQIKGGYSPMANTNGLSLVFDIHSKRAGPLPFVR